MKRLARIAAGVLLAVVAVSALLVGGTLTALRTHWGSDRARRLALSRVNAAIAGTLDVGRFQFGGDRVTCDDVALRAPDGAVVVRVSHVELEFTPLALFRKRVHIRRLSIDGPALDLRQGDSGSNLDRALAPRHPSPASAPATGGTENGSLVLELDELRVRDGALEVSQTKPGAMARVLGARGLVIDGHGHYETGPRIFGGAVDAGATIEAPLRAPLSIHASGTGHGPAIEASLSASLEDTALAITLHGEDGQHLTVHWPRLHVTPAVARALLPAARLLVPIDVNGQATRDGALVSFASDVRGAAWRLDARGALDLASLRARDLSIDAHDIDLGATIAGLPRSRLSLDLHAQGGGTSLGDLDGGLELEVPAGTLDGIPVAPSSLRLTAKKGHVTIQALRLTLPGLVATGQGAAAADQLALALSVHATDLHELTRVAAAFAPGVPSIAGRGTVALSLSGTPAAPGVSIDAAFPSVSMAQNHLSDLRLAARVPDARQPLIGEAHLRIASALLGGRPLRTVIANLRSTPPRLAGDVSVAGGAPIDFIVEGAWAPDHRALDVAHLSFRYPQGAWSLTRPARLVFEDDHLALSRFDLVSGSQRLAVDLDKRGPRVRGAVHIAGFDLSKLPPLLLPPGQSVAGWVDAAVALDGTVGSPDVHANVHLRDGSVGRYHDLSLSLEGHYADRRAVGALDATGLGTSVRARFDAPTTWPLTNVHQPLALDVVIPETDIAPLLAALGVRPPRPVAGRLSIAMHLAGTAATPALQLDTKARALVMDGQPVGDLALRVQGDAHTPLSVSLALGADAGAARTPSAGVASGLLSVHTDLSLASLAVHPPTTGELLRAPVQIAGQLHDVSLAGLSRLGGTSSPWAGTAALRLSASGTALAPAGALALRLSGVSGPGLPATDARLDARIDQRDTRVALRIARDGHPLAWASAIWGLAASRMQDRAAMARAPLELTAGVGPLLLHRTGIPGSVGPAGSDELKATLRAEASIKGSLARPEVAVTATVRDARLGQQPLGTADATLDYATGRARAEAWLRSASGGALHVTGHAKADLAYPQVARLDAGAIPFEVNLSGDRFDLGWLSGLNRTVRQVGGQLAAGITAQGTPRAPRIQGQLEWSNGTLMLTSLGSYRSVHLKMHGDQRGVRIDDLRLASGDGDGHLQASAQVQTGGAYALDATASLRRFPVYGQGQALATLSVDSHVSGTASARGANGKAAISEAHIELNDVKQKKLQPLQRPADVVLMDGGRPADETGARQLAAWNGSPPIEPKNGEGDRPVSPSASPPFAARLAIDAPRNLWVHGKDAALELGLGPDFRVESGKRVAVYGQVLVHRGRIDVLGRRFDLQPSSVVQFSGPPDRPRLDVTAKYYNETELITVMLTAKGTLDKLAIAVSSPERPDLTEGQLYTLIVTGRLQLGGNTAGSTSASGQAASLVGGLVAAQLQKTLAHKLPLDVLTLEAGDAGLTGSRLEAGTYLTSKLYAGYVGRVGANPALLQNRNAVHLEYQLSRRWSLDAEYGDIGTGTADLLWTKNY